ncbi:thiolase family protein [Haladaptatus sp. NG-SE-30]
MNRVAIAGYATEGFQGEADMNVDDVVFSATKRAFDRAAITRDDLDATVLTGQDTFDGAAISDGRKVATAGGYGKPSMRVQNGGGAAVHHAAAKIRSGKADVVSVTAADTVTTDPRLVSYTAHEALFARPIGQNNHQSYGFMTTAQLERRDVSREDLAATAAKNYAAASNNPTAHRREAFSKQDVLEADPVVGALTELMVGPLSFGAATCVLVSEEVAADRVDRPVWLSGSGLNSSRYSYRDMDDRLDQPTLRKAAQTAYEDAGVDADDVDTAEIAAHTPTFELLSYETLDFCETNDAAALVSDGVTAPDGDRPVNISGGPLATNPPNTGGIYRTIAAAQVLNGDLGSIDAETALVADNDMHLGEPGRTDAVLVLEGGAA